MELKESRPRARLLEQLPSTDRLTNGFGSSPHHDSPHRDTESSIAEDSHHKEARRFKKRQTQMMALGTDSRKEVADV